MSLQLRFKKWKAVMLSYEITFKRWLTIIVYGFLSAFLIKAFIQVEWTQKVVIWCGNTFDLFGVYSQKIFLIILGFLLYQFLLKMNIYSKKSSIRTWIVYPPVTFTFVFTALFWFVEFEGKAFSNIFIHLILVKPNRTPDFVNFHS